MIDRIKDRTKMVKTELTGFTCRLASGDATCLNRTDRIFIIFSAVISMIMLFGIMFSYASGDIIDTAGNLASTYYGKLFGYVTFIAGLAAIICLIWITISPTANGARTPLEWLKRILVSYIVIMLLGGIFAFIKTNAGSYGTLPGN